MSAGADAASAGWVDPSQVEHALAELWRGGGEGPGMVRACLSNLVVLCTDDAQRRQAEDELPEVARRHPSRVLLVVDDAEGAARDMDARVTALCHVGGRAGRTCSEQILLQAGGPAAEGLPAAVTSLLLSDLPTVLWWLPDDRPPPAHGERFRAFGELAGHLLYDSGPWLGGPGEVVALAEGLRGEDAPARVGDLAWLRLEPWRQLLSQTLDPARAPGALRAVRVVEVEHGPRGAAEAWLLGGWLARCLDWRAEGGAPERWRLASDAGPVEVRIRADADTGEATPGLRAVRVVWRAEGGERDERFERTGPGRLAASGCAGEECAIADPARDAGELVVRELSRRSRQGLFRESLDAAWRLARAARR